ncbi:SDR family oxidoreductase [Xinfangfangia sp. CPCC 101601]|uniref:SDR family oxidoreductase n=1 Tax=Pseudogemmobacter lacusdianii TaxID=3069608 RepID=A0ABU0VTY0_9RHOB|nr:SDR family oxidoreductase [Xinfangfangia sp. CPCC 101601]MDQ2065191.1 SDR family oxidoreductase [Xinfangfangia sp. CPCC 101601]
MTITASASGPLAGQSAIVTGGAGGIGLATCRALAALGAAVTFTARSAESLAEAEANLTGVAKGVLCDITDSARLAEILAPGFDILVNNAAIIHPIGRITDISIDAFSASIETNLTAQFAAIKLALPAMLSKGRGTIVNVSSGAAHRPKEGWSAYCAGKAGLAMLTRAVALEYAEAGIRIFGIAPGVVDTGMQVSIRASGINPVSQIPREELSPAVEPGQAIAWLCTPEADPYAGQELDIREPALREAIGLPAL